MSEIEAIKSQQRLIELADCGIVGVKEAKVQKGGDTSSLEWDRYMRLNQTALLVKECELPVGSIILDVGGYDGAFALFVPNYRVWVIDPATTGIEGLVLPVENKSFDVVVSIDALEHVQQTDRAFFLQELVRVCRKHLFINFPEARSTCAQNIALQLTNNRMIREHVEYVLPSAGGVTRFLQQKGAHIRHVLGSFDYW